MIFFQFLASSRKRLRKRLQVCVEPFFLPAFKIGEQRSSGGQHKLSVADGGLGRSRDDTRTEIAVPFRRLVVHHEAERTALHQLLMGEIRAFESAAVERCRQDVFVAARIVFGDDAQVAAIGQMDGHGVKQRPADGVGRVARAWLVEAHGVQYIPSRHLSAVLVARKSLGAVVVE